jgi:hypothetical protein
VARRALTIAPQASVALMCSVVVSQLADGLVEVQSSDPLVTWSEIPAPHLRTLAEELHAQLKRVVEAVKE